MNLGIVVEGPSDGQAYPALLRRIRTEINWVQVRECGGKSKLRGLFPKFLKEFQRNRAWQIELALVIRDSDCSPSQDIEQQLRNVLRVLGFEADFKVEFFAAKCDLETWLLADENAINQVSEVRRTGLRVAPMNIQFEVDKAKKRFFEQLSRAGLSPSPEVYKQIASRIDLERTAARCPSFRRFITTVRDC